MIMQTWLPYPNFEESVKCLRLEELAIQRYQVLELMEEFHQVPLEETQLPEDYKPHHLDDLEFIGLITMWTGYELQLCEYGLVCCDEWQQRRSKRDPMYEKLDFHLMCASNCEDVDGTKPNWFGDVDFHLSHQAGLVRIAPAHYSSYFQVSAERPLEWPESKYAA